MWREEIIENANQYREKEGRYLNAEGWVGGDSEEEGTGDFFALS